MKPYHDAVKKDFLYEAMRMMIGMVRPSAGQYSYMMNGDGYNAALKQMITHGAIYFSEDERLSIRANEVPDWAREVFHAVEQQVYGTILMDESV